MLALEEIFKVAILAVPPVVTLVGILRSQSFWPLVFFTFIGATISFINFRVAGQLSDLSFIQSGVRGLFPGDVMRLISWLSLPLFLLGFFKMLSLRKAEAIKKLLEEEQAE